MKPKYVLEKIKRKGKETGCMLGQSGDKGQL